ncbi:hypothetical protein COU91_00770 [Candidatus Saccharibacteria bacterium CG10_big_fil_rev_8_21_14_0_10_47_8]|nr:MAG: hypothetical protein COU91_00770 [Candidatus Saccharibacteria bacterium CG10_big_fil_rev_8_21_14_0_10_47_8]
MASKLAKSIISLVLSTLLLAAYPIGVLAESAPPADSAVKPVCPNVSGTTAPTGSSAGTYKFNDMTCLWENDYYTWNPVTKVYTPKFSTEYVLNPATGNYESTTWVYVASEGKYKSVVTIKPADPPAATTNSAAVAADSASADSSISGSGPDSANSINNNNQSSALLNLNYDAQLNNGVNQTALSGNATLQGNTVASNATSGNATDVTNILNLLQSTFNLQPAQDIMVFTANINGDVTGDLYLDPSQINTTGPGSVNTVNNQTDNNLTVNSQGSGLINNDIKLDATSGNVNMAQNTKAGNATSGNANAVANLVNMINTAITAGQSFLGVLNINGNLNGDILLPPNFLDQLIASGAPQSTVNLSQQQVNNVVANLGSNQTINNDVNLSAASGNVNMAQNTKAGNATSGNASTNLTVFNLTGRQVVGANSLMVFVNVLGQWVGLIVDAPAGSNSAAYCGGSCQISDSVRNNAKINDSSTNTINNNLDINARSGGVGVTQNTNAGDATSGDATASANLANVINSQLSLTDWFGFLFINVFGTWHGSFGINTDAGELTKALAESGLPGYSSSSVPAAAKVFQFIPKDGGYQLSAVSNNNSQSGNDNSNSKNFVLGANTGKTNNPPAHQRGGSSMLPLVAIFAFLGIMSAGGLAEYGGRFKERLLVQRLNAQGQRKAWLRFTIF